MSIPPFEPRSFRFEYDHLLTLKEAALTLTIDPIKNSFYYLVPSLAPMMGAWFHGAMSTHHQELRVNDLLQATYIDELSVVSALTQVETLKNLAGISREIKVYTSKNYTCSSYGGYCSLTSPIISIPRGLLIKDDGEANDLNFKFSADESLFFIAREVANLKSDNPLIRVVSKVLFAVALFFIKVLSLPLIIGAVSMAAAVTLQIIAERFIRSQLDRDAVDLLTKFFDFESPQSRDLNNARDQDRLLVARELSFASAKNRAFTAAKNSIKKLMDQNIERRKINNLCKLYITENGNNFMDLLNPFLSARDALLLENEPQS